MWWLTIFTKWSAAMMIIHKLQRWEAYPYKMVWSNARNCLGVGAPITSQCWFELFCIYFTMFRKIVYPKKSPLELFPKIVYPQSRLQFPKKCRQILFQDCWSSLRFMSKLTIFTAETSRTWWFSGDALFSYFQLFCIAIPSCKKGQEICSWRNWHN